MPEIWLKYGSTDIALDINFGNLLAEVSTDLPLVSDEDITTKLSDIPMKQYVDCCSIKKSQCERLPRSFCMS